MNSASDNCSNNSATMMPLQQATGVVAGATRTIRWAAIGEGPFIHAEDLCNALGWRRPDRVLKALRQHIVTAGLLGIEPSFPEDRFINTNGADELFARRTGGIHTTSDASFVLASMAKKAWRYRTMWKKKRPQQIHKTSR